MTDTPIAGLGDTARGPRTGPDPASPFFRSGGRNRFTARRARVVSVEQVAPVMVRVRVSGPDFVDFVSDGPADHVRVFFPDPVTGALVAPSPVGPGEDGILRPKAPTHARDFTPLSVSRVGDDIVVDLDFFLHASPGPAAQWAARARMGDEIVVVGPRGSKAAPQGAARAILVGDETALPSITRWLSELPFSTAVNVVASVEDNGGWVADYLAETSARTDANIRLLRSSSKELTATVASLRPDASTFVFAAGEAAALIPLRRLLRRDLALAPEQVALSGYWKSGTIGFDHHSPVDPSDPD
ncbi:siderophore-interacting protein [Microbacterium sp. Marseille-Q6648]|uniref:siderophore-interacting protein n=1 Tax=Microbacterium sp. Marseille-Q6648 TaxID=2937991 RepID=UPI002557D26A|nr:siderophore-interacting protein [Microbacterium sp. Marseille-Q6648]